MVEVLYMDGSSEKLTGANIKYGDPPGCYIATAVYGSYDCPQVWTLRRFRDDTLRATSLGRWFIRTYCRLSPPVARRLKHARRLNALVRALLDRVVERLDWERSGAHHLKK